jgi:predicted amidohydrolase
MTKKITRAKKPAKAPQVKVALVQLQSGNDMEKNIAAAEGYIAKAAKQKAQLVLLPENVAMMSANVREFRQHAYAEKDHPALAAFRASARKNKVWLLIGSLSIKRDSKRLVNRSFLLDAKGNIAARYDKIHLFDATLPSGERYGESARYAAGARAVVARTPWGGLGMSVCYDVRFPHLYRDMAQHGARMLAVPAAFTEQTGKAHWHILLRARAIETGCFVLAPGMTGNHPGGRKTFGHSLIIDPWGNVLADAKTAPGIISATLDLARVAEVRQMLPSLSHDRKYLLPETI